MMPKPPEKLRVVFTCRLGNSSMITRHRVYAELTPEERERIELLHMPFAAAKRVNAHLFLSVYPSEEAERHLTPEQMKRFVSLYGKEMDSEEAKRRPLDMYDYWTDKALTAIRARLAKRGAKPR